MKLPKIFTTLTHFYKPIVAILIILLLSLIIIAYFNFKKNEQTPVVTQLTKQHQKTILDEASKERINQYYQVYQNPNVIYLRQALNAYLAHDSSQACISQAAVSARVDQGIVTGLDSFDKSYYKSKFIVFTIDKNKENGEDIQIIFKDKPDRVFYAWLGDNPYKELCLLGFNAKEKQDKKVLQSIIDYYKPLISDKNYSL